MICNNCGNQLPQNATICNRCGNKISQNSTKCCQNCGSIIDADSTFCVKCGNQINSAQTNTTHIVPAKKNTVTLVLVIILTFVVGITAGFLIFLVNSPNNNSTSDQKRIALSKTKKSSKSKKDSSSDKSVEATLPPAVTEEVVVIPTEAPSPTPVSYESLYSLNTDSEKDVEEVVTKYTEAVLSFDFGEAINYLSEDTEEYAEFFEMKDVGTGVDALVDSLFEDFEDFESSGLPADSIADMKVLVSDFVNDLMSKIDVEINSIKIDDDKATVEITGTSPDFESDFESAFTSALESSVEDAFTEEALLERYGEEVLAGIQSEEEIMELIMPDMLVLMEDAFSSVIDDAELVEMNSVYVLNNIDGKWLIVSIADF